MNASELVSILQRMGVQLKAKNDRLLIEAPTGILTPELKQKIMANKPALLALLADSTREVRKQPDGPYTGFLVQTGDLKPNPVRAQEALTEAERWRQKRVIWLRDVLGVAPGEER